MSDIGDFIEKAERFLRTAKCAMSDGDFDSCASRCYYAMFLMAEAVLRTKDLESSSHKGVIRLFGQHFVKTGLFEKHLGRTLSDAYDKRLVGDYNVGIAITQDEAEVLVEATCEFIHDTKDYLNEWIQREGQA